MKKVLVLLWLALLGSASATTPVTGSLKDLATGAVQKNAKVRLWLRGCGGNQPRALGTALIGPTLGTSYFKEFLPDVNGTISGTVYSTRDAAGTGNGDIDCGGSRLAVWYGVQIFVNGVGGTEVPVHAKSGVTLDLTSVVPITVTPVVPSPTGDTTYARLDGGNMPFAGPITALSFSGSVGNIPAFGIDPTAPPYSCSTLATDNSSCLQAAINAAIAAHSCLKLPPGTLNYLTTLVTNSGIQGVCIQGHGMNINQGGFSAIKYNGSGDALTSQNGAGSVFFHRWRDFAIISGANATSAVHGDNVSESRFEDIGIWSDGTHVFTHGWFGTGWNIDWISGIISSNGAATLITNGVKFSSSASFTLGPIWFRKLDTFQLTNIFNLDGSINQVTDEDSWHETQNVVLLLDDTTNVTSAVGVHFINDRFLFNGALASFPDSKALKVNNVAGKVMALHQVNFSHVAWFTNQAVTYPMAVTFANAGSQLTLGVGSNSSFVGATTGLVNSSLVASSQLQFNGAGYESLNSGFGNLGTLIGGSGGFYSDLQFSGLSLPNGSGVLRARNAANSAYIDLAFLDGSNNVNLGAATIIPTSVTVPFVFTTATTGTQPIFVSSTTPVPNLTVQNCGATCAITRPTINTGVSQGSGFKHQRFGATTATAATAGATSTTTYTWTSAFADANYTLSCTGNTQTNTPGGVAIESKTASNFVVRITAITAAASSYAGVDCVAVHD